MNDPRAWADLLERYGRNGDTMLAHITPAEAKHLKKRGGAGTINPVTGLPEFWGGGETSDSPGSAGGGNGDNGVSDPGGFGGNTSFGWGPGESFGGSAGMGPGASESSIGGAGGDGNSYADQSIGGTMGMGGRGMMVSPEMGGHVGRARGHAAVAALGDYGRNVNRASSVMAGQTPSFGDKVADAFGMGAPGGFAKSGAAAVGAGLLGSVVAGPLGAMAGYHGYNAGVRGAPVGQSVGGFLGGVIGGPLGAMAGSALGGMVDGSKTSTGATVGTGSAPPGVGGGYHSVSDPTAHTNSADYGARAGTEYQIEAPEKPPEETPSTGDVPKDWDELGFLERNPEVKAAVENGTWKSGYAFNSAYQASAGVPYEAAMTTDRNQEWLSTKPGQAVPYRGAR